MRTYLRILGFARPLGWMIPQYALLTVLHVIFSVVNFAVLIPLLEILFDQQSLHHAVSYPEFAWSIDYARDLFYYYFGAIILEYGKLAALQFVCGLIVGSVFLSNLFRYLASLFLARARVNIVTRMRHEAFEKMASLHLGYFSDARKGDIISRITTDIQQIELTVVNTLKVLFKEPLLIMGYFAFLLYMSVELTVYTLLLIPISGGLIGYIAKRLKKRATRTQASLGRMNTILDETISGMRIVKAFSALGYVLKKFRSEVNHYGKQSYQISVRQNLASPTSEFLGVAFMSLLLLIGGQMVLMDEAPLQPAEFIGFLLMFSQTLPPAKALSNAFSNLQRGIASGDRIFQLMDTRQEVREAPGANELKTLQHSIRFESVTFRYDDLDILKDITLEIPKGKIIALVGPSGAGKSTLADLIPRFYDPTAGRVTLDGTDLKACKVDELRQMIGLVTQESILFNDTIYRNIVFGNPDASEEEVLAAARVANAHDFIVRMEDGYQTNVGESGAKLSGGQRQRISIARAILKNPPVLIMDEATSALDSESEKLVQEAINHLMQNRTTIVIAHRLSTIQHAHEIVVMQEGQIIQQGTHDKLMRSGGLYARLIEMQSV
ncbi:MAG: ABC transporter ATP-binding protein [Cyclobacteriaceae bacterium]|nr:ABC transporter ATP-binding protein [Cyclobacteriaceae bacterium HetDA_MAG_MS6]